MFATSGVSTNNQPAIGNDAIVFSSTKLVTSAGFQDFWYQVTIAEFTDNCIPNICFDCVSDLTITIQDECGAYIYPVSGSPQKVRVGPVDTDGACSAITYNPFDDGTTDKLNIYLDKGTYTITKVLSINKEVMDEYAQLYVANLSLECLPIFESLETAALNEINMEGCDITCSDCLEAIGTEDDFLEAGGTAAGYAQALAGCNEICGSISNCRMSYLMMLSDMMPGGQYAHYEQLFDGTCYAIISICKFTGSIPETQISDYIYFFGCVFKFHTGHT